MKLYSINQKQDQVGHERASSSWERPWPRIKYLQDSTRTTFELKSRETALFNYQNQDQLGHKRASGSWERPWEDNYKTNKSPGGLNAHLN